MLSQNTKLAFGTLLGNGGLVELEAALSTLASYESYADAAALGCIYDSPSAASDNSDLLEAFNDGLPERGGKLIVTGNLYIARPYYLPIRTGYGGNPQRPQPLNFILDGQNSGRIICTDTSVATVSIATSQTNDGYVQFTTSTPHGLTVGVSTSGTIWPLVRISGHDVTDHNGVRSIYSVESETQFTCPITYAWINADDSTGNEDGAGGTVQIPTSPFAVIARSDIGFNYAYLAPKITVRDIAITGEFGGYAQYGSNSGKNFEVDGLYVVENGGTDAAWPGGFFEQADGLVMSGVCYAIANEGPGWWFLADRLVRATELRARENGGDGVYCERECSGWYVSVYTESNDGFGMNIRGAMGEDSHIFFWEESNAGGHGDAADFVGLRTFQNYISNHDQTRLEIHGKDGSENGRGWDWGGNIAPRMVRTAYDSVYRHWQEMADAGEMELLYDSDVDDSGTFPLVASGTYPATIVDDNSVRIAAGAFDGYTPGGADYVSRDGSASISWAAGDVLLYRIDLGVTQTTLDDIVASYRAGEIGPSMAISKTSNDLFPASTFTVNRLRQDIWWSSQVAPTSGSSIMPLFLFMTGRNGDDYPGAQHDYTFYRFRIYKLAK